MNDPVLEVVRLGGQWPTVDPFLFCVHHLDAYPAGDHRLAPSVPLVGRSIGQDFANVDGWNMYHGSVVPGFPQHPHRGFETITFVRHGYVDHSDSLGATARFGRGDVQWMTAGAGVVHSEMFPLLDRTEPNPLELFQIWLNLPAADKMVPPYFTMFWDHDIPRLVATDDDGRTTVVTVIAGNLGGATPPPPPPDSWASRADSDLAIWHVRLDPGARWIAPAASHPETVRVLYVFEGDSLDVHGTSLERNTAAVLRTDQSTVLVAGDEPVECLVLQGRPIGEPVAQYGPFVMNDRAGVEQAFADYQRTQFGGWPWPADDPVHAREQGRFARHADGRIEIADGQTTT